MDGKIDEMHRVLEDIQEIKWLIDEGPAHAKLTEAQVRLTELKAALSAIDPEDNALKVGRHFCSEMPCSPSDCDGVPCRYMEDAVANRNNRDPEAIRREARAEAQKETIPIRDALERLYFMVSQPDFPIVPDKYYHHVSNAAAILAEEPKEREAEWHTYPPAKDGLYLVEVSAKFSSPSPWYETAFYRNRDGWTRPKTSEGEEVLAWMEIPRRAEVERKLKEAER